MSDEPKRDLVRTVHPTWLPDEVEQSQSRKYTVSPRDSGKRLTATECKQLYDYSFQTKMIDDVYSSISKEIWDHMDGKLAHSDFNGLADACQQIEQGIRDLHIPLPDHYREQLMELIVARIGLACAHSSDKFDSFQFAERARKNARRGAIGRGAKNPRSLQRSKP